MTKLVSKTIIASRKVLQFIMLASFILINLGH